MLEKIFLQILNMSFTASFVVIFVLIARLLLKKAPKALSYALWAVVLFRLICPFSFESVFSLLPTKTNPISQDIIYEAVPTIDTGIPAINHAVNSSLPAATPAAGVNPLQVWVFVGTMVWLLGIAVLLCYSIVSLMKLQKRLRSATLYKDNIFLSDGIDTAFVMGVFRPQIYLPRNLNDIERHYILLHEQTHIRRLDHVIKLLSFFVLCLHWFNPLVWAAFFISGRDMEMSCDEAVIKQLGSDVKKEYSASLLTLATGRRIIGGTPLAFGEGDTKGRIKNVLNYKKPAFWMIVITALICIVAAFCFVSNPMGTNIQNPYVMEYIVGSEGMIGAVDTERFTAISEDFAIGADKYGRAVFKEPHKAFTMFENLYSDAIAQIQSEYNLKKFSHKNYDMYKVYGWQLTNGTETERERARFVTTFLDIYENSFSKTIPNNTDVEPTLGASGLGDLRPMVMIDGTLYLDTGKENPMGVFNEVDGTIKTNVSQDKKPAEHEQSNFGFVGSEYVMGENFIQVNIDGKWIVFEAEVSFTQDAETATPAQQGGLTFFVKPDEPPQVIGDTAAVIWLKTYMEESTPDSSRIEDYKINEVTVISGTPKAGQNWEDMNYHYVVRMDYDITTASDEYFSRSDGISGKGTFKGLFRELCVKDLGGGNFDIISAGTGGGESEFAQSP